jgi:hypothetical protein
MTRSGLTRTWLRAVQLQRAIMLPESKFVPSNAEPMNRFKLSLAILTLLCSGAFLIGSAQDQQTIDSAAQQQRPPRASGPFPGSPTPGHSAALPIRLELLMPTRELRSDETTLVDFIITNIGNEPIKLPSSVLLFDSEPKEALTLWLTSDGIKNQYLRGVGSGPLIKFEIVETSAELDGRSDEPKSFLALAPNKSIRVHASTPQLKAGTYSFTAHAELGLMSNGTNKGIGTADSEPVTTTLSTISPTSR